MSAALAVQKALRARLAGSAAVTALVPATAILDRNKQPAPDPSIILGEDHVLDPGTSIARNLVEIHLTLHLWKKETGLVRVKAIAGAIGNEIKAGRLMLDAGYECCDCRVSDSRFLRDPDGETAHGVVTVVTLVREVAP